ncbi:4-hydroxythreonine-4-phosphate dehydrogenase PdxA [Gracilimonas sp.]|uniref:4-hydroxythreonine-4-phosphate dehydrogenase PdxA n=1 Tax=Gracilimonas sp. TaxID=1974203 RepID=UPI0028723F70|nr:4-hydroxythreonine-4-phosphate dehydrogenase PdxA [Gracilimonas sp.]
MSKPRIAISIGDFNGIGPEIILKTLSAADLGKSTPVIMSPKKVIDHALASLGDIPVHFAKDISDVSDEIINVLPVENNEVELSPGVQSIESGKVAMQSIEKCIDLCVSGETQAMVTAPISKESVNLAGYKIPGHTEFLASQTQTDEVLMMLVSGNLRVALVTTHIPVSDVSKAITSEAMQTKLEILINTLKHDFGIEHPKIAVFGLNPHAGDGGVIGKEEIDTIDPVIKSMQESHKDITLNGPFPADGFFGQKMHQKHDAILAMYHDQGLAPFKLLSFGKGVNFTAGLPIIRTSPDHGTAFDIAGKGIANPSSFKEAYELAVELANKRTLEN